MTRFLLRQIRRLIWTAGFLLLTTFTATASTIGSINGDITIAAGKTYNQTGSDLLTPLGNIDITARTVNISAAQQTEASQQSTTFKQSGLSIGLSSPVVNAVQTVSDMAKAAKDTSDPRMKTLAAATAALAAKNGVDAFTAAQNAAPTGNAVTDTANALGGLSLNISFGSSKSSSQASSTQTTARGSSVVAGGDVSIAATEGDVNVIGSSLSAGRDAVLSAANQVNLLAAANTSNSQSSNKSSSASIGVSLSSSGGLGVNAGVSGGKGKSNGADTTYTNSTVTAGNTAVIQSGTDTNIKGATVSGKQVIADVGTSGSGNLNIESLQDSSTYNSSQRSAGVSVGITTSGVVSGSVNASKSNVNSNYQSVTQQSGIQAGDGGFDVNVNGNTSLTGAVIASTDAAIKNNTNRLATQTLTTRQLQNQAEYSASSVGLGLGYSTSGNGVGTDSNGKPTTEPNNGAALPSLNGVSATPPVATSAGDTASSTTKSAISGANINITDNTAQQQLTGKDAATTVALLDRDTANAANPLTPIFTDEIKQNIQTGQAIIGTFSAQVGTFLSNRAAEADQKTQAAKEAEAKASDPNNGLSQDQRDALLAQAAQLRLETSQDPWAMGGTGRTILTAVTAAASGNITGSSSQFIQSAAINYLQSLGAEQVKQIADSLDSETARTALQGLLACSGAAAQGQSCGSAASGAAASVVLNNLLDQMTQSDASTQTAEQKQARENLVNTLITGITAAAGGDAAVANSAAKIEAENNALALKQITKSGVAIIGCLAKGNYACAIKAAESAQQLSQQQKVAEARGVEKAIEERYDNIRKLPDDLKNAFDLILKDPEKAKDLITQAIAQLPEAVYEDYKTKFETLGHAYLEGGEDAFEAAGKVKADMALDFLISAASAGAVTLGVKAGGKVLVAIEKDLAWAGGVAEKGPKITIQDHYAHHKEMVEDVKAQLGSQGYEVNPKEISFGSACGIGRCRPDIVARAPDGSLKIIEIKTGDADLSIRQSEIFPQIKDGDAIPRGDVAAKFGLRPGIPLKDQSYPNGIPIEVLRFPGAAQ